MCAWVKEVVAVPWLGPPCAASPLFSCLLACLTLDGTLHIIVHMQAGLDSVREQLVEERLHELRRCEEGLKAGVDGKDRCTCACWV